jgi:uncharacterized membrane protein YfcA
LDGYATQDVALVVVIAVVAALVQGYSGFGFGIVASSLLAFTDLPMLQMTVAITVATGFITVLLLRLSHGDTRAEWRQGLLVLAGVAAGQPLGYWFIHACGDEPVFRVALGTVLVGFGITGMVTPHLRHRLPAAVGVGAGMVGGFLSGAFVTGGPPIVAYLYSRSDDPRRMKATVQFVFLSSVGFRLACISVAGDWSAGTTKLALVILPAVLPAVVAGHYLSRRASNESFRRVVYALIGVTGVGVLVKGIAAWVR